MGSPIDSEEFRAMHGKCGVCTVVTATAAGAKSAALSADTIYKVICKSAIHYLRGADPTAAIATSTLLPANSAEYMMFDTADKLGVILATGESEAVVYIEPKTGNRI